MATRVRIDLKQCTGCTRYRELQHFRRNRKSCDGLDGRCKACRSKDGKLDLAPSHRLQIQLPKCEVCGLVGKMPSYTMGKTAASCMGPQGDRHKRQHMKPHWFVEVGSVE